MQDTVFPVENNKNILREHCSLNCINKQESPKGILTGRSDPPHPSVSQMLAILYLYEPVWRTQQWLCDTAFWL